MQHRITRDFPLCPVILAWQFDTNQADTLWFSLECAQLQPYYQSTTSKTAGANGRISWYNKSVFFSDNLRACLVVRRRRMAVVLSHEPAPCVWPLRKCEASRSKDLGDMAHNNMELARAPLVINLRLMFVSLRVVKQDIDT